jgi:mannose-6-phosphate isomerase-like protein (cupin superfamily)
MRKLVYLFIAFLVMVTGAWAQKPVGPEKSGREASTGESSIVAKTASDAPAFPYDGGLVRFLANREETGKQFSAIEVTEPPGYKTPRHRHTDADEAFYVVEGNLTAQIGKIKGSVMQYCDFLLDVLTTSGQKSIDHPCMSVLFLQRIRLMAG